MTSLFFMISITPLSFGVVPINVHNRNLGRIELFCATKRAALKPASGTLQLSKMLATAAPLCAKIRRCVMSTAALLKLKMLQLTLPPEPADAPP